MKFKILLCFSFFFVSLFCITISANANQFKLPEIGQVSTTGYNTAADFSPDGKYLVTGDSKGIIYIWSTSSMKLITQWETNKGSINKINFSPDGKMILVVSYYDLSIWDASKGILIQKIEDYVKSAVFNKDGSKIYYLKNENLIFWNTNEKNISDTFKMASTPHTLDLNFSNGHLAIGLANGDIAVRDSKNGNYIHTIKSLYSYDDRYTQNIVKYEKSGDILYNVVQNPAADGYTFRLNEPKFNLYKVNEEYQNVAINDDDLRSYNIRLDDFIISPDNRYLLAHGLSDYYGYARYFIFDLKTKKIVSESFLDYYNHKAIAMSQTGNLMIFSNVMFDSSKLPKKDVTSLSIVTEKTMMQLREMQTISLTLNYNDGTKENVDFSKADWTSSNEEILKFTFGKLEAVSVGKATIHAVIDGFSTSVEIEVNLFNELESVYNADPNKTWSIKFSKPVNIQSIKEKNMYITDVNNEIVPILYYVEKDNNYQVHLIPVKEYEKGQTYTIWVKDILSDEGAILKGLTKMNFHISK